MIRANVVKLIADAQPRGVFETTQETTRTVFCTVRSITMQEAYTAKSIGLNPEYVFVLANYREYGGEKLCEYESVRYRIVRTYVNREQIELVCERVIA